jgi:hypothetical protein
MRGGAQSRLPFGPACSRGTARLDKSVTFATSNAEAAAVILSDPARYGGEGSLVVAWAREIAGIDAPKARTN